MLNIIGSGAPVSCLRCRPPTLVCSRPIGHTSRRVMFGLRACRLPDVSWNCSSELPAIALIGGITMAIRFPLRQPPRGAIDQLRGLLDVP